MNKNKRWETEPVGKLSMNDYVFNSELTPDGKYFITDPMLSRDVIRDWSRSFSGYHCLRLTHEERGRKRSEHKKNKNYLRKLSNNHDL